ncbi:MAG: ThuA domain-containing protein, partial [Planctomycetota bacterium]
ASLDAYDAVVFNNTNNEIFLPENFSQLTAAEQEPLAATDARLKQNLVEFLEGGRGLAVIHAGVASFREWPEFGKIMGARFDNHPWNAGSTITIKVDDPVHPLTQAFAGSPHLEVSDEIYQLTGDYSRDLVRVLVSVDMERTALTPAQREAIHRTDSDFPLSFVKSCGRGRVFYGALGHQHEIFWNRVILQHYLDGIQFALGDLEADTTPSNAVGPAGSSRAEEQRGGER